VPARSLGTYEVEIRLHREVKATLTIEVVPQEEGEE
jgi:ribosomal protein L9